MADLAADDSAARERALDVTRSFIVQAPAGSGKTTVLTQRYLRLLAEVAEPEQVLAITFTRKAAGEMRERVRLALDGAIEPRSPADSVTLELAARVRAHAARLGWGIDESAARLRIQTIDSFNSYLAHSLPVTSRSGFSRGVTDEPGDLYRLAARETLRHAESDATLRVHLERVLRRLDDNWSRLEELIAGMFGRRSEWLPNLPQLSGEDLVARIEAGLEAMVSEELADATAALDRMFVAQAVELAVFIAPRLEPGRLPTLAAWLDAAAPLEPVVAHLPRWRALAELALTGDDQPRKRMTKNEGIRADDARAKQLGKDWVEALGKLGDRSVAALAMLRALPDPRVPEREKLALDSLAQLLYLATGHLTATFNGFGESDYAEIAGAARHALTQDSSPTPLAERLGTRLQHILVDEFQDTSRDQYELLVTLTQDWSTGDGRTLFLVGDPMQSIYGFRNAEVGRFSSVRDGGLGNVELAPLELRRNFRSAPALVHWCNDAFAKIFPRADDARSSAVRHLASVAARDNFEGTSTIRRVTGDDCAVSEARDVAVRIAALRAAHPEQSIAVLAGVRSHLRDVRRALKEHEVPFIGVKLEPLADLPVVRDLEALARALDAPLDRIAWLAVLRAPFVGLTLPDLTAVAAAAAGPDSVVQALGQGIAGLTPDGFERVMRVNHVLVRAWHERELEPRAHFVERVWLALGGAATCDAAALGAARRFLAALDADEQQRTRGRQPDLENLMRKLYAEDPAEPGAVSLMTIHGAKGLEFDHVFVLGVGRRGRGDESQLLNWVEMPRPRERDRLLMAPIRFRGDDEEADAINTYVRRLLSARGAAERARQAYVALTRAKRTLHVYAHPRARSGGDWYAGAGTLLHSLWPAIGAEIGDYEQIGDTASLEPVEPAVSQLRARLPRPFVAPAPPPDVLARGADFVGADEEPLTFDWARQTARRVGTVVHEALERFGVSGVPALADLPRWRARIEARLRTLGVDATAAATGADRALVALRATLEDPRGRWLFDVAHRDASSELALSGLRGTQVVNAVIDRTFVDADGTRWIVDYKTSPHEGGDLDGFLAEQVRRYTPQLQRYAHLVRELGPAPVKAGLYFPLLGAWREVPVN